MKGSVSHELEEAQRGRVGGVDVQWRPAGRPMAVAEARQVTPPLATARLLLHRADVRGPFSWCRSAKSWVWPAPLAAMASIRSKRWTEAWPRKSKGASWSYPGTARRPSGELVEERLGVLQIGRVEALGEPAVHAR